MRDQNQRIHDEHRDQNRPPRSHPGAPRAHPPAERAAATTQPHRAPQTYAPHLRPSSGSSASGSRSCAAANTTARHATTPAAPRASRAFSERRGSCRSRRYDRGDGGRLQRPPRLPGACRGTRCRSLHAQPARRLQPGRGAAPGRADPTRSATSTRAWTAPANGPSAATSWRGSANSTCRPAAPVPRARPLSFQLLHARHGLRGHRLPAQNRPPGRQHPLPPPQNRTADHDPHRTLHPVDSRPLPFVGRRRHALRLPDP